VDFKVAVAAPDHPRELEEGGRHGVLLLRRQPGTRHQSPDGPAQWASYSVFVVHPDVQGSGRFTPWGDAEGTTNNFTADSSGTASVTNSVPGCLTNRAAAVVIWHSDGVSHRPKPGTLGVTWHNSLITALP